MKRKLPIILLITISLVALPTLALSAEVGISYHFLISNVPCFTLADMVAANSYWEKQTNDHMVDIRYNVVGSESSMGFTNLIGLKQKTNPTDTEVTNHVYASKWMMSDGIYYSINSNSIFKGYWYAPAVRGNTKFYQNYGITSITIEGSFNLH